MSCPFTALILGQALLFPSLGMEQPQDREDQSLTQEGYTYPEEFGRSLRGGQMIFIGRFPGAPSLAPGALGQGRGNIPTNPLPASLGTASTLDLSSRLGTQSPQEQGANDYITLPNRVPDAESPSGTSSVGGEVDIAGGQGSTASITAKYILEFEARRDANGHLVVYNLPSNDGGGRYEVAGINQRYDPQEAAHLAALISARKFEEAERYALAYYISNTNAGASYARDPGVELMLRDTTFNRGLGGVRNIIRRALGTASGGDRNFSDLSSQELELLEAAQQDPSNFLNKLRNAREDYERNVVGVRPNFWNGLVNRWDRALAASLQLTGQG